MRFRFTGYFLILMAIGAYSCRSNSGNGSGATIYKGVYTFGQEQKTFTQCNTTHEVWVADSSKQLELKYSQLNFEKPDVPVYIEVEGEKVRSGKDGLGSEYDSTLVVRKVIKITKEIPQDVCNLAES